MELKVLSVEDRPIVTKLFRDVFTREPWNDDWSDPEQLNTYIDDLAGQSNSLTLGYFDSDKLVGLSMGHIKHWFAGTEYLIDEFCVETRLQGKGVGTAFMRAIEAFLIENGIRHIFLQTESTVPAYKFYLRSGFTELKEHVSFAKTL